MEKPKKNVFGVTNWRVKGNIQLKENGNKLYSKNKNYKHKKR